MEENRENFNNINTGEQTKDIEKERIKAENEIRLARIEANKRLTKEKEKEAILREKNLKKIELRQQKIQLKNERKKNKKGNGGFVAAIVTLSLTTLIMASVLVYVVLSPAAYGTVLNGVYSKSFYDTVKQVDNIDTSLSKFLVTNDTSARQNYLMDTVVNSELAQNNLHLLPLQDENKYYTTKLINQIGDYSKYLNKKLNDGEELTEEDLQAIRELYNANLSFKQSLQRIIINISEDFNFSSMTDNGNIVIDNFNELQNLSVSYPELIYDGPFSDGRVNKEMKGLTGSEITLNQAEDIFREIFSEREIENIEYVGESNDELICYNIQATEKGEVLFAQISKVGGKLIAFSFAGSCMDVNYSGEQAILRAKNFLEKLGLENMQDVWINLSNNVYTINFAYSINDIPVYSDLIKVRICAETGMVIGLEGISYYTNHTERVLSSPEISSLEAKQKVSSNITIETSRLVVVPIGESAEKLCYEFSGKSEGATYYVYIDAITGKQVEMFKVIESTEGTLLI